MAPNRDEIIRAWLQAKSTLDEWKAYEKQMRELAIDASFVRRESGSETLELGGGYKLAVTFPQTYKIVGDEDALQEHLDLLAKHSEMGAWVAENLVKWKPSLDVEVWKQLNDETQQFLAQFVEVSSGQAGLKFTEPKS